MQTWRLPKVVLLPNFAVLGKRLGKRLGTGWGSFRVAADRNLSTGSSCHDDFNYGTPRLALPAPGPSRPRRDASRAVTPPVTAPAN